MRKCVRGQNKGVDALSVGALSLSLSLFACLVLEPSLIYIYILL